MIRDKVGQIPEKIVADEMKARKAPLPSSDVMIKRIQCKGTEDSLLKCRHSDWKFTVCEELDVTAGVKCQFK